MSDLTIQEVEGGVVFTVKVIPGSSKTAICSLLGDMLKVKIAAAAEKGKANQAFIDFLAKQLGVKKNAVSIISGQTKPVKQIQILGISKETLVEKLGLNKAGEV
jgi:hypothetical protein